jgi:hypothetical protein
MRVLDDAELTQVTGGCYRKYVPVCRPKLPNGTMNGTNGSTNGCYATKPKQVCAPRPTYSACKPAPLYKPVVLCRPVIKTRCGGAPA